MRFAEVVRDELRDLLTSADKALKSNLLCFAAEEARVRGEVVDMEEFRRRAIREATTLA